MSGSRLRFAGIACLLALAACTAAAPALRSAAQARAAAQADLASAYSSQGAPRLVSLEQTTFARAAQLLGLPAVNLQEKVWLGLWYNDAWQLLWFSSLTAPAPTFRGCIAVIVNADDGTLMDLRGPVRPGVRVECDPP